MERYLAAVAVSIAIKDVDSQSKRQHCCGAGHLMSFVAGRSPIGRLTQIQVALRGATTTGSG